MKVFVNISDHPHIKQMCSLVVADFDKIVSVYETLKKIEWPEKSLYSGSWLVSSLKYKDTIYDESFDWIFDHSIQTAGFSILGPNTKIHPHRGNSGDIYRLHLGISCPAGDCAIQVGDDVRQWRNLEFLMFEDQTLHSAWNKTNEERIIMLIDFKKEIK